MSPIGILLGVLLLTVIGLSWLVVKFRARLSRVEEQRNVLSARYKPVLDVEAERERVAATVVAERARADAEIAAMRREADRTLANLTSQNERATQDARELAIRADELRGQIVSMDDVLSLQSYGLYPKRFDFATSALFDRALEHIEARQKSFIRIGTAAVCTTKWTVDGSRRDGERFAKNLLKLMLRAFNGECDAAIAKVRYNNLGVMIRRIRQSYDAINRLTVTHQCHITKEYLELKIDELQLVYEQQEKIHDEREEQRAIREQMREEEIARRELERARNEAEREEERYASALEKARAEVTVAEGAKQQKLMGRIAELQRLLAEATANKERAIARAQMTRSGHVYVISNIGSFGEHIYKIGMTRRLDPMERIHELSDASVPFSFDVHAVIYSEDAPTLENELHRHFAGKRLNMVNMRKEFFCVSLDEIAAVVSAQHADLLITKVAEAREYRKTIAILEEHGGTPRGWGSYDRRGDRTPKPEIVPNIA